VATPGCVQHAGADYTSGTGAGGTSDGPEVILAFERAYYVQRSGSAARALTSTDSSMPSAVDIQRGIDAVPVGTRYCVRITPAQAGAGAVWAVDLTEQWPGAAPAIYHQSITTTVSTGRTLIAAVAADD
jgi:hypothetical protein